MNWKILKTEEEYQKAVLRMMEIFDVRPNTKEFDELELLTVLIQDYDEKHYVLPELNILDVIKIKMEEMSIKSKDLEPIIGSKGHVSSVLSGKRDITLKMAKKLMVFFNIPAELFLRKV